MKTGGKSPYFSPVGGANEAAHILSLMGGRAAIQGRKPNGQLGAIEYTILEQPRPPEPKPKKPERENPAQLNTNRSSKEKSKKDLSSTEGSNPILSSPKAPRGSDGMGRDRMRENTTYVRNIKKYLLAALYNAPATIDSYYTSLVSHDMYGGGDRR